MNIWLEVLGLLMLGFYLGWIAAALFVTRRNHEDAQQAYQEGKVQAWYEAAMAFGVTPPDKITNDLRRIK